MLLFKHLKIILLVPNQVSFQQDNEEEMGESKVRKLLVAFEKKAQKNQEMRVKYPDLPEKLATAHPISPTFAH